MRKMVGGLTRCTALLRGCSYARDDALLDYASPDTGSPYVLDMSEPYSAAVLSELASLVDEDRGRCVFSFFCLLLVPRPHHAISPVFCFTMYDFRFRFQSIAFRDSPKGPYAALNPSAMTLGGANLMKPGAGLKIEIARALIPPSEEYRARRAALVEQWSLSEEGLGKIVALAGHARADEDRAQWLRLAFADVYVYAHHVRRYMVHGAWRVANVLFTFCPEIVERRFHLWAAQHR